MASNEFGQLAVIGAGNMGSGIAQKLATEGFDVVLVDLDDDKVARGISTIKNTLDEGVERKIFAPEAATAILGRVQGTSDWSDLKEVDLVIEAVFEDLKIKDQVFARLEEHCRPDAILATNTSSFHVADLTEGRKHPERIVGLHYFYHPAKNRLVEVVPAPATSEEVVQRAWALQEQVGKTPIASADASGFVVNRYFVPWLNEAVRLFDQGVANIPTIEAACKETFGVGMGPFELMNVTGIPIALHAATTLGEAFGPMYAPDDRLRQQVEAGDDWDLSGEVDKEKFDGVNQRMLAVTFLVAGQLVDEGVGTIEDTDIGARVGLRWPRGPFEMMNRHGVETSVGLVEPFAQRWSLEMPASLKNQATTGQPFPFSFVRKQIADGVATLTINRPDAMNALNETVVGQLRAAFDQAADDQSVRGIVIAGAGKAFIAGADIRFFVKNIEAKDLERIVGFTREGQELLNAMDACSKPVVARIDGIALGGGLELALACDALIATPKAAMAFPETGIGIYPGLGGTQRAPRRVGKGLAKWMIFTGQMLSAEDAERIGLVDRVVPPSQLDQAVIDAIDGKLESAKPELSDDLKSLQSFFGNHSASALRNGEAATGDNALLAKAVKSVGHKAPVALELAEKLIDEGCRVSLEEGLALELDHLTQIFSTEDAYEGLSSLGRRRPVFKGH